MINQKNLKIFNKIYDKTYNEVVKFMVCKCSNMDDVNDIVQEVYLSLYKKLAKLEKIENINSYILGIIKNKINKYYGFLYKFKTLSLNRKKDTDEFFQNIPSNIDIEKITLENIDLEIIWKELKKKKIIIQKIFYLYYN